jgi:hypothetical protein
LRKSWAFLVGINEYTDYATLRYCVDDVRSLEDLLNRIGYVPVCLHDRLGSRDKRYPSRTNILAELKSLLDKVGEKDLLLVYFACHGVRSPQDTKPMLIAADTRKRELASSAISILDDLEPAIRASKAQQKVMLLDACFIGQGRGETDSAEFLRKVSELASGFEVISASTEDQEALESSGLKHSIFCHFVLKGLAGEATLGQNAVMLSNLKSYLMAEIAEYTVRLGLDQMPQGRSDGNLGDFMLVDYTTTARPNLDELQGSGVIQSNGIQIDAPTIQGRGKSPANQVTECLWTLDCEPQCQTFKTNTTRSRRAAAFVVQAKDTRIQHWLVKRLVNQIPNVANARVFPFVIPTHPMWRNRDFGELWLDLSRKLQCSPAPADAIHALVEIYQTKPIIIAMYGWSGMARSQALQKQVLTELWNPLVEVVGALETQPMRSRIILFLAEGHEQTATNVPLGSDVSIPIRLDPLTEITPDHIADWIESNQVFPVLSQLMSEEELQTLIRDEILEWGSDPVDAIEQICYTFKLENGIADIEAEWRLAG